MFFLMPVHLYNLVRRQELTALNPLLDTAAASLKESADSNVIG